MLLLQQAASTSNVFSDLKPHIKPDWPQIHTQRICYTYNVRGPCSLKRHTFSCRNSNFVSLDVSWGRQREVFPPPGSQDFPRSTINFHFGKSTHTHTHTQRRSSSCPATVPRESWTSLDLTFIVLCKTRERDTGENIGSAQVELSGASFCKKKNCCHLLEGGYRDTKGGQDNDRKQQFHCRLIQQFLLCCFVFVFRFVHSSRDPSMNTWNGKTLSASSGL